MPTGYTAGVADGTITSFQDYAYQCARAFGALVTERDNPITPDLPTLKVDEYYAKKMKDEERRLSKLSTMTDSQIEKAFLKETNTDIRWYTKRIKEINKERERYQAMLEECRKFKAPTQEHINYREFLISQLERSISFDCDASFYKEKLRDLKKRRSAEKWWRDQLKDARHSLKYAKKSLKEEEDRVKARNEWLDQLRLAVEKVQNDC